LAANFVKRGAHVVLIARTRSKLVGAVEALKITSFDDKQIISYVAADCSKFEAISKAIEEVRKIVPGHPEIDFLVTCAGTSYPGYFLDQPVETFEKTMSVNYMGSLNTIKAVAPFMVKERDGSILCIASACAVSSFIGYASYSPSKYALRGLCDAIRNELSGFGI